MYIKNADQLFTLDSSMTFGAKPAYHALIADLGSFDIQKRTDALVILRHLLDTGEITPPIPTDGCAQVHTWYSFSPYTPAMAIWMAKMSGLATVCIADDDSVGGAREFIAAGERMRITTVVGAYVQVNFENTGMEGKTLNNPFEPSVARIAAMGIPPGQIEKLDEALLAGIRHNRNVRTAVETWNVRSILPDRELRPDFWNEVIDYSLYCFGNGQTTDNRNLMSGSVSEQHLLFTISKRMVAQYGRGARLISALLDGLKITLSDADKQNLMDTEAPQYIYTVLNILNDDIIQKIYQPSFGDCELPPDALPAKKVVQILKSTGCIPCYCYTGNASTVLDDDKNIQNDEDDNLDALFPQLKDLGFEAFSYRPAQFSKKQLRRVVSLCEKYEFLQLCGNEISRPGQKFNSEAMRGPAYDRLKESAWALAGHAAAASANMEDGIFSPKTKIAYPNFKKRIAHFKDIGLSRSK